jgi:hypothetical protein
MPMGDVFYRGPSGLLSVDTVSVRNKAGISGCIVVPRDTHYWSAEGMANAIEVVQVDRTLFEEESNKIFYGFDAPTGVLTLPSILQDGINFGFVTNSAGVLRIDPDASNNIVYSVGAMTNGEFLEIGNSSNIFVISAGTSWIAYRESGTLTEETP